MANVDLTGKRVLIIGAETATGRAIATHLAGAGARVAVIGTATDGDTPFAMKRLSRKLGGPGQAIDGTNDMAVRVMVRQISKELGSLDAIVCAAPEAGPLITRHGGKELDRSGGKHLVYIGERPRDVEAPEKRPSWLAVTVHDSGNAELIAEEVARTISGGKLLD